MPVIDSYSETNKDSFATLYNGSNVGFGQCFTGDGEKIIDSKWYLRGNGAVLSGNAVSKIYTMTGTFGVNGNVGTLLATSDNVPVSGFAASYALITFNFSGANQYLTTNGTHYVVTIEYSGGDASHYIEMGYDGSSATHPGTWTYTTDGSTWNPLDLGFDLCFYVDGVFVDVTVNLTGVVASPAIGSGTIEIEGELVPPLSHATEPIRIRRPRKIEREPEPLPDVVARVRQGAAATVIIGAGRINTSAFVAPFRYDMTVIGSGLIDSSFPFGAAPMPVIALGNGTIQITSELYPEEIAALLDLL